MNKLSSERNEATRNHIGAGANEATRPRGRGSEDRFRRMNANADSSFLSDSVFSFPNFTVNKLTLIKLSFLLTLELERK